MIGYCTMWWYNSIDGKHIYIFIRHWLLSDIIIYNHLALWGCAAASLRLALSSSPLQTRRRFKVSRYSLLQTAASHFLWIWEIVVLQAPVNSQCRTAYQDGFTFQIHLNKTQWNQHKHLNTLNLFKDCIEDEVNPPVPKQIILSPLLVEYKINTQHGLPVFNMQVFNIQLGTNLSLKKINILWSQS